MLAHKNEVNLDYIISSCWGLTRYLFLEKVLTIGLIFFPSETWTQPLSYDNLKINLSILPTCSEKAASQIRVPRAIISCDVWLVRITGSEITWQTNIHQQHTELLSARQRSFCQHRLVTNWYGKQQVVFLVQWFGVGLVIERLLVRLPAGALSSQLGQLSLPSLRGR